jgi:hypothetical protein
MYTISKAERVTGLEIRPSDFPGMKKYEFAGYADGFPIVSGSGPTASAALRNLVDNNYRRVSRLVLQKFNYRCANCGRWIGLQIHHVVHRSKGRRDLPENLLCFCALCHGQIHGKR